MPRSAPRAHADTDAIADRLHSIAIHLLRRVRAEDVHMGLSAPRASALSVLVYRGPLRLSALAALEQVRGPTMTRTVNALVQAGLAKRSADRDDARASVIAVTPAGRKLLDDGRRRRVRVLATLLQALPPRERKTVRDAVTLLEARVEVPRTPRLGTPSRAHAGD